MGQWTDIIRECAITKFGIKALLPVQLLVVHNIMEAIYPEEDRDCYANQLVILPTGTGKSACFQIPADLIDGPTIIIYPLLSLINDQLRRMNEAGVESYRLIGGMSYKEQCIVFNALKEQHCKCILTNPETLENDKYIKILSAYNPALVVVDEAHCISKWGKSFRSSYLKMGKKIVELKPRATVAFTATASDLVIQDIKHLLFLEKDLYLLHGNANRENITYSVLYCSDRDEALVHLLKEESDIILPVGKVFQDFKIHSELSNSDKLDSINNNPENLPLGMYPVHSGFCCVKKPTIVFCSTRTTCYRLALMLRDRLSQENIFFYHAGLTKSEKTRIEEWFLDSEDGVLIATCAYGMGVDKSNIRTVIHYEMFTDVENFLQETGRAGRDRQPAVSVMLAELNQLWKDNEMECRRAYFMECLGLDCEFCSGCDKCMGYYPIVPKKYEIILRVVDKYEWCFDERQLVEYILEEYKKDNIYRGYIDIQSTQCAVSALITNRVLKTGNWLWKGKVGLSKKRIVREKVSII